MQNLKGKIKSIQNVAKDTFKMDIISDLKSAKSGQFISILCPNRTLRRPFSISGFEDGITSVLFKIKGEGTDYLSKLKENSDIDFLAPLGNGFNITDKKSLLVGAGIGVAPLFFLKKELNKRNIQNYLISGFKAQDEVIDGSDENVVGGSVLDNLDEVISKFKPEIIYSCGPKIVLENISKINIESQLALEKVMACSIGVCRGCVIKLNQNGTIKTASVCKDGPVFKGSEIIWN